MSNQLPYLQSERHFRLYESYIEEIVRAWPTVSVFKPVPPVASVETLSSRIRLCWRAYANNLQSGDPQWPVEFMQHKFVQIGDDLVISTTATPGFVTCGPMDLVRNRTPLGVQVQPKITQVIPKVALGPNCIDLELVKAIIVLHHHRLLCEPSTISTTVIAVDKLAESYDVAVEKNGDTYTII